MVTLEFQLELTPNGRVNEARLVKEIDDSSITVKLRGVTTDEATVHVSFANDLPDADRLVLEGLLAAHDGTALPVDVLAVMPTPFRKVGRRRTLLGMPIVPCEAAQETSVEVTFAQETDLQGAKVWIEGERHVADTLSAYLVHPVAGVVHRFVTAIPIPASGYLEDVAELAETIPAGMVFRFVYESRGSRTVTFKAHLIGWV